MNHQQENISSGNMYYPLESLTTEETANANKGFDTANFGTDLYDMDTEVNYQELFSSQDQAVPDFLSLNTPPVTTSTVNPLSTLPYMSATDTTSLPVSDGYHLSLNNPAYYSPASHSVSPSSQHAGAITIPETMYNDRNSVIVPSATAPEPKPRRKGGRKPKNDPLPPHLEERRRLRRIRNKEAAQKCRERRLAQTDELMQEIEQLETQTRQYEEFINRMREYKDQCEFVLSSHKAHCNHANKRRMVHNLTLNTFSDTSCAVAHRRTSSSEGEISSPTFIM